MKELKSNLVERGESKGGCVHLSKRSETGEGRREGLACDWVRFEVEAAKARTV